MDARWFPVFRPHNSCLLYTSYFVANEIRQHPDKETKKIVLVIDPQAKTADVILPAGASTEVDNEIPGKMCIRDRRSPDP